MASSYLPFNAAELGDPSEEYVAWVDVMGIRRALERSPKIAANFVYKIHHAALTSQGTITLYPVMDGLYACSPDSSAMKQFLSSVFRLVANEFVSEDENKFKFVVRGAVAHGAIYHGGNLSAKASWTLNQHMTYRAQILLGLPMVQAHVGEPEAPPFGVFADGSASDYGSGSYPFDVWWKWYGEADADLVNKLRSKLDSYYEWCTAQDDLGYDTSRIRIHRGQASLYLRG